MFDPSLGRWITEDPTGFDAGDVNLYRYEGNNSINQVDPSGLQPPPVQAVPPGNIKSDKEKYRTIEIGGVLHNFIAGNGEGTELKIANQLSVTFKKAKSKITVFGYVLGEIEQDVKLEVRGWRAFPADKMSQTPETRVFFYFRYEFTKRTLIVNGKRCPVEDGEGTSPTEGPLAKAVLLHGDVDKYLNSIQIPKTQEELEKTIRDGLFKLTPEAIKKPK